MPKTLVHDKNHLSGPAGLLSTLLSFVPKTFVQTYKVSTCPPQEENQDLQTKVLKGISRFEEALPGRHFWAIGFGCWSTGNLTDRMVNEYLEHHRKSGNDTDSFILVSCHPSNDAPSLVLFRFCSS